LAQTDLALKSVNQVWITSNSLAGSMEQVNQIAHANNQSTQ
jgi:hypothetical protein